MIIYAQNQWVSRVVTFFLGAFAASSLAFWALKLSAPMVIEPVASVDFKAQAQDPDAVLKVLGGRPTTGAPTEPGAGTVSGSPTNGRFSLVGVISTASHTGAALIAVDGNPPKPFVVGSAVEGAWVLRSVQVRKAVLVERPTPSDGSKPAEDAQELILELPDKNQKGS